jgi:hypothetical protein
MTQRVGRGEGEVNVKTERAENTMEVHLQHNSAYILNTSVRFHGFYLAVQHIGQELGLPRAIYIHYVKGFGQRSSQELSDGLPPFSYEIFYLTTLSCTVFLFNMRKKIIHWNRRI